MNEQTKDKNESAEEQGWDNKRFEERVREATRRKYTCEELI